MWEGGKGEGRRVDGIERGEREEGRREGGKGRRN